MFTGLEGVRVAPLHHKSRFSFTPRNIYAFCFLYALLFSRNYISYGATMQPQGFSPLFMGPHNGCTMKNLTVQPCNL